KKLFLKDQSVGKILSFSFARPSDSPLALKIKLEVDANPPLGSGFEQKFLTFPFPAAIITQDPASLFAGKSHALLCRPYVKGRDWFDFIWYVNRQTPMNFQLLSHALDQLGPWKGQGLAINGSWYLHEMERKIRSIEWPAAKADVQRFLKPHQLPSLE